MDMSNMTKQMIDFQKSTFTNTFNTITMLQDQSERMMNTFMDQTPGMPQQTKEAFNEWVKVCKKARDDFKKTVDESFKNLESYVNETVKA